MTYEFQFSNVANEYRARHFPMGANDMCIDHAADFARLTTTLHDFSLAEIADAFRQPDNDVIQYVQLDMLLNFANPNFLKWSRKKGHCYRVFSNRKIVITVFETLFEQVGIYFLFV